jgi:ribose/xylose/arabinose/galactoside ABC-type transport system permease subunit
MAGGSLTLGDMTRAREMARHPVAGLLMAWAVVVVIFALIAPNFLTGGNVLNVARASAIAGIAAIAITVPLIAGSLDVSFGALMSIGSVAAATRVAGGDGVILAVGIAMGIGALLGLINGALVVRLRLDAFIVTLGTLSIFGGVAFLITGGAPTAAPGEAFAFFGRGYLAGIPIPVWTWGAVAVGAGCLLRFTAFGRQCYAVGDNRRAAALAGIPVRRVTTLALVFSGAIAALAGTLVSADAGVANPGTGERYLLTAIAGVILGGTALTGGVGSVIGSVVGILFLGTIDNGLNLLRVEGIWQDVIAGLVLVAALIVDRLRDRYR